MARGSSASVGGEGQSLIYALVGEIQYRALVYE